MSDNASATSADNTSIIGRSRAFNSILYGGLVVGVLDGLFALVFYGLILGVNQMQIFQSVAAGLLGKASYKGGIQTFLLGILLHFVVAICIAAVYYLANQRMPILITHAFVCGLIYGMLAYLVMNYVVIPLSAASSGGFNLTIFLTGIIGHAFLVGLPIALITRHFARR
ncbi:MAG: hypothetical protein H0X30_38830 [Anaerolineae bacterium]|nr:hypothetical protein [Anaerolineae bacterium]